jgi:hypothetical protein
MKDKNLKDLGTIDNDKYAVLLDIIRELITSHGDNINTEHIAEVLKIVADVDGQLLQGTSQAEDMLQFADIEQLVLEQERLIHDSNLRNLFNSLKRTKGEDAIVKKKDWPQRNRNKGKKLALL